MGKEVGQNEKPSVAESAPAEISAFEEIVPEPVAASAPAPVAVQSDTT